MTKLLSPAGYLQSHPLLPLNLLSLSLLSLSLCYLSCGWLVCVTWCEYWALIGWFVSRGVNTGF